MRKLAGRLGVAVGVVFVVALLLRLPVVFWELPGQLHNFSYHPDELPILGAAANVDFASGDLNPEFYNYGTLHVYAVSVLLSLAGALGLGLGEVTLLARLGSAVMGSATAALCCAAVFPLGAAAGWVAGLFVALAGLHAQQCGFMTVDGPACFWVSLVLFSVMREKVLLAGVAAGFAAATKYSAGAALTAPVAWLGLVRQRGWIAAVAMVIGAAAVAFGLGCPGSVLYHSDFMTGLTFEAGHAQAGHGLVFKDTGPGAVYHLLHSLLPGLGWPLLGLGLAGLVALIWRGSAAGRAVAVFALLYFALISFAEVRFARYTLPLVPALAIGAGFFYARAEKPGRMLAVISLLATLPYTLILQSDALRTDPRTAAASWIRANIERGSSIALPTLPWFYSPPLSPRFGELSQMGREGAAKSVDGYRVDVPRVDWDVSILGEGPDAVVISSFEEQDRKRLNDPDYLEFSRELTRRYKQSARFGSPGWYRPWTLVELPHDMGYVAPEIRVYERKDQ